ncbi:MAG: nucleotidyl transferase AbiEii/AbiGii toxin family protein [Nitrospirota bacterium]
MDRAFYFEILYPLQDRVLKVINAIETGFYLTGGTASSRGYLHHRFSDDLDLFVNDDPRFTRWADRVVHELTGSTDWRIDVIQKDAQFARLSLQAKDVVLKVDLVNDVPSHLGDIRPHPVLGRIDSPENILANKVTAVIDRHEPKDLADIWGFCRLMGLSLDHALTDAHSKAAGLFPADLARVLCAATPADWEAVRWIAPPPRADFVRDLRDLGERLIL